MTVLTEKNAMRYRRIMQTAQIFNSCVKSPLVEALASAVLPHLDKPFAFFGHTMGALVSFELARLLRREYGNSPIHLFISGRRAPQIPDPDPPIHVLPERELIEELRRLNGTPSSVLENAELMGHLIL